MSEALIPPMTDTTPRAAEQAVAETASETDKLRAEVERLTEEADGEFVQAAIRIMQANPGFDWRDYQWDGITADDFESFFTEDMSEAWAQVEKHKERADKAEAELADRDAALARALPSAVGVPVEVVSGIYIASKAIHGPRWREWRDIGHPIVSTWIDEAEAGRTTDWHDLWRRCISEASQAAVIIVYRETGEELKGARVEVGAALAHGRRVIVVGDVQDSWTKHPNVTQVESLNAAMSYAGALICDAALASGAQAGAAGDRPGAAPADDLLPCDVKVQPATIIREGCSMSTLMTALDQRRKWIAHGHKVPDWPGAAAAGGLPGVEEIAEALYEVDGLRPNGLSWAELRDTAETSGYHRQARSVVVNRAAAIRQRLSAAGMGDAGRNVAPMDPEARPEAWARVPARVADDLAYRSEIDAAIADGHGSGVVGAPARPTAADGLREAVEAFMRRYGTDMDRRARGYSEVYNGDLRTLRAALDAAPSADRGEAGDDETAARAACVAAGEDPDAMVYPGITMPQGYTKPSGPPRPWWTFKVPTPRQEHTP